MNLKFRLATLLVVFVLIAGFPPVDQSPHSLADLLVETGSSPRNEVIVPSGVWTVTADLEIDRRISLTLQPGALIQVQAGRTLRVHGPFIAPMNSIFGSEGKVVFSGEVPHKVLPAWWGALGDGRHDDTAAIQSAIDSLERGEVSLGRGTYLIGASTKVPGIVFLTVKANITLSGAGRNETVLKVRDNSGPYHYIMTAQAHWSDCSGFRLRDLTIDSNIANNPIRDEKEIRYFFRMSVAIYKGSDIVIERVEFRNESSINTVSLNGVEVRNVRVSDCLFNAIGDDPNHIRHDHSSIYTHATNVVIQDNEFRSALLNAPGAATAIETHGSDTRVEGNKISGYQKGMNITGISFEESRNVFIKNNIIEYANYGISLWSYKYSKHISGYGFWSVTIENNKIRLAQNNYADGNYSRGIYINPDSNLPLRGLKINNNEIIFGLESHPSGTTSDSFGVGYVSTLNSGLEDTVISNNKIINSPSTGIRFECPAKNLAITGNAMINPGSSIVKSLAKKFRVGIYVASNAFQNIVIKDNTISDDFPQTRLVGGIFLGGSSSSSNFKIENNHVSISQKKSSTFLGHLLSPFEMQE